MIRIFQIKVSKANETVIHYIGLFSGLGLFAGFAWLGWQLVEYSDWFASIWESMFNRISIIIGFTFGTIWFAAQFYSYFWGKKKLIRTFKKVDKVDINEFMDGDVVRIHGALVSLDKHLVSPLTQRECSAYTIRVSVQVERVTTSGSGTHVRNETAWETLKYVEVAEDFLIRCGDDFALIKTEKAKLIINSDSNHEEANYATKKGGFLSEQENEKRKRVLESVGVSPKRYVGIYAENVKFVEGVLEPDELVVALGLGKWVSSQETNYARQLDKLGIARVFEVGYTDEQPLYISDSKYLLDTVK